MCQVQQAVRRHCQYLGLHAAQENVCADHAMHIMRTHGVDAAIREGKAKADKLKRNAARQNPLKYRPAQMSA